LFLFAKQTNPNQSTGGHGIVILTPLVFPGYMHIIRERAKMYYKGIACTRRVKHKLKARS
jgi:hypothetical protein